MKSTRMKGLTAVLTSAVLLWSCASVIAGPTFVVTFGPDTRAEQATGRLLVYLVRHGSEIPPGTPPASGPFWHDPQAMFGVSVRDVAPGEAMRVGDGAAAFPGPMNSLPAGTYDAQAVLDLHEKHSSWRMEAGNLHSKVVTFTISDEARDVVVELSLDTVVGEVAPPVDESVTITRVLSPRLAQFHGREVYIRAGVVRPVDFDPSRRYPAVYEVPGFGGDHHGAFARAVQARRMSPDSAEGRLARSAYWIVLDPESGNGHTLFADSANNGPAGAALVHDLIPALEAEHNLIAAPSARLLRGHSSGGWSTLWLTLMYPETFGGCWSTAPDPVDFRRFQLVDIYAAMDGHSGALNEIGSMYIDRNRPPRDVTSYRSDGRELMTIRQENLMEEVLGPDNASGQQWDSWQAVFGPRAANGRPAALYDAITGEIDAKLAQAYRAYDISWLLSREPGRFLPMFRDRVRLVVGDQDNFYLEEAVKFLSHRIDEAASAINEPIARAKWTGYVRIVKGYDHGSVDDAPDVRRFAAEMLDALRRAGHVTESSSPRAP